MNKRHSTVIRANKLGYSRVGVLATSLLLDFISVQVELGSVEKIFSSHDATVSSSFNVFNSSLC